MANKIKKVRSPKIKTEDFSKMRALFQICTLVCVFLLGGSTSDWSGNMARQFLSKSMCIDSIFLPLPTIKFQLLSFDLDSS